MGSKGQEMTNKEILEQAIQKAIDGGWKPLYAFTYKEDLLATDWEVSVLAKSITWIRKPGKYPHLLQPSYDLIFNHDFAKALWGESDAATTNQRRDLHIGLSGWKLHLQQMVIAENPLEYLKDNM